jgi:glucose-6-phosphate 1-dehydrogenase
VPFYLRTGKRLGRRVTEVAVVFKRAPHLPFTATSTEELTPNTLVIRVQPDEGMTIRFGAKVPGTAMEIRDVNMDFAYGGSFTESSPEAYERLILDVLLGDPPLFPRHEEVELSWKILDPILAHWEKKGRPDQYGSGTWGPASADAMLARDGRVWRRP